MPLLEVTGPVFTWKRGQRVTDYQIKEASRLLQSRWRFHPEVVPVWTANARAALYGGVGTGSTGRIAEGTHTASMAGVFCRLVQLSASDSPIREKAAQAVKYWVYEDKIDPHRWAKRPDAIIEYPDGNITIHDFGGNYSSSKLRSFHEYFSSSLRGEIKSYAIW